MDDTRPPEVNPGEDPPDPAAMLEPLAAADPAAAVTTAEELATRLGAVLDAIDVEDVEGGTS